MGEQMIDFNSDVFISNMSRAIDLCNELTGKTYYAELGPCDGKLYMQLCDTLTAWFKKLEDEIERSRHSDSSDEGDVEPPSNRPTDPKT